MAKIQVAAFDYWPFEKKTMAYKLATRLHYQIIQCSAILTPFIEVDCWNPHLGVNIDCDKLKELGYWNRSFEPESFLKMSIS